LTVLQRERERRNEQKGEEWTERLGEVETGVAGIDDSMSLGCTSFDKRELRLLETVFDLEADHVADAGVTGDVDTFTCAGFG
jgi:hypothetical protein